jgi:lipopolysaccharide biosynthesis regulator YciM
MKKIKLFVLAICALCFAACSSSSNSDSPQKVVKEYFDLVKAGKFDKAVKCFYFEEEIKAEELNALAEKLKEGYGKQGGIEKYEIISEEITKDEDGNIVSAKVATKVYYKDGKEDEDHLTVIKVNGEWKIDFSVK